MANAAQAALNAEPDAGPMYHSVSGYNDVHYATAYVCIYRWSEKIVGYYYCLTQRQKGIYRKQQLYLGC